MCNSIQPNPIINMKYNIDNINSYLEFPVLDKIHGEPTYSSLQNSKNQLKVNTSQVTSDLGGRSNGYLGLVLTPTRYTHVHTIPYVKSAHLGALHSASGTTNYKSTRLREEHKSSTELFIELVDVKKALIKKIMTTIETKYLDILRSLVTNTINIDVPTIFIYLFTSYSFVTPETLAEKSQEVK